MASRDSIVHELAPDFQIWATQPMPLLSTALEAEIDRQWAAAQTFTGGRLFNGRIFCADVITPRLICGHWSEYRREVAQLARHDLFPVLGQRSLAVGGVVRCAEGVLFGRRPDRAIYQPGEWQLPPAGTVDAGAERAEGRVDVLAMLHTELEEELGLRASDVGPARPLCLVEHVGSHVLDLGFALETPLDAAAVRARHRAAGDGRRRVCRDRGGGAGCSGRLHGARGRDDEPAGADFSQAGGVAGLSWTTV